MDSSKIWVFGTVVVALYGCLKKIHPEQPYIAQFYYGPRFNFTKEQVDRDIYPVTTYTNTVAAFVVVMVTDWLRYKPVVVMNAVAISVQKGLLGWGTSLFQIQLSQFFLGLEKSCTIAYKTYIYCITDRENYQIGTAIARIATKFGMIFSSTSAQAAKSVFASSTEQLVQVSFVVSIFGLICALLLPPPRKRLYFNEECSSPRIDQPKKLLYSKALRKMWKDIKNTYTDPYLLKWCVWWILAKGAYKQVSGFYVQSLWNEISQGKENKYNAAVESLITVAIIISLSAVGSLKVNWKIYGDITVSILTTLLGALVLANAYATSLALSYPLYITFVVVYDVNMMLANSEVAKQLKSERFALIFGIQTFLAFCFNTFWTQLIVSKNILALEIRDQFRFMSCVFLSLGLGFALKTIFYFCKGGENVNMKREEEITQEGTKIGEVEQRLTGDEEEEECGKEEVIAVCSSQKTSFPETADKL